MFFVLLVVVLGILSSAPSLAQCPPPSPPNSLAEGAIGLFFDPAGTQTCVDVPPMSPFRLYVVARVPEGGVAEYEAPTLLPVSGPAVLVNGSLIVNPGYEPLIVADACDAARRTDPSTCPVTPGDLLPLAVVEVFAFPIPATGVYCFKSACESIIGEQERNPWFWRCDNGMLESFTGGDLMCISIGTEPVAAQASTWTLFKRLFTQE